MSVIARVYSFTWYFCLITQYAYVYRHDLFLFINLRKRLTIINFELMRWDEISYFSIFMIYISISVLAVCLNISTQIYVTILLL